MLFLLSLLASLYVLWVVVLVLAQGRVLFPRHVAGHGDLPSPPGAVRLAREMEPGVTVEALFFPAPNGAVRSPAVMFFHGNAERMERQDEILAGYGHLGFAVLLPEYRGYGRSGGTPSQAVIRNDATAFHGDLLARPDVDPTRIVLHGRSIGGSVAADLAAHLTAAGAPRPAALILESTPANVADMAWRFGVPPFLVRNPYRTDGILPGLGLPLLLLHGTRDGLVPKSHAERLHALVPDSTLSLLEGGHNDLVNDGTREDYWREIGSFLSAPR